MNPKEKAKKLLWMFLPILDGWTDDSKTLLAKKCAKKLTEEMIRQLNELRKPEYTLFWHGELAGQTCDGYELKDYWAEVLERIDEL